MDKEKKFITAEKAEINEVEQSIIGWGSKPVKDRDDELIESSAWKLDSFRKNPVIMLCHDYSAPPVGKALWVKADSNGLKFKAKFANTERGREVYQLFKEGIMSAFSVGFKPNPEGKIDNPKEGKYKEMGLKRVYTDVELLEISCVPIPSNSEALIEAVKSGKIKTKQLKEELEAVIELVTKDVTKQDEEEEEKVTEEKTKKCPECGTEMPIDAEKCPECGHEMPKEGDTNEEETEKSEVGEGKQTETGSEEEAESKEEVTEETKEEEEEEEEEESKEEKNYSNIVPSVFEIMSALERIIDVNGCGASTCKVIDLIPSEYPNGSFIYMIGDVEKDFFVTSYTISYVEDGLQVKIADNDIPVAAGWVEMKYGKEVFNEAEVIEKAGRSISAATKEVIKTGLDHIIRAQEIFEGLYGASEEDETEIKETDSDIKDLELELEENEEKDDEIEIISSKSAKQDETTEITDSYIVELVKSAITPEKLESALNLKGQIADMISEALRKAKGKVE